MLTMTRNEAIPLEAMRAGHAVGLGDVPRVPRQRRPHAKAVNLLPYVPSNPLLIWVMGLERAKAGVLPTDEEHRECAACSHEAMDAGALRLVGAAAPTVGPSAVQRDYDGTPMATDVMHDETCRVLAAVLAERNEGFIQMTS